MITTQQAVHIDLAARQVLREAVRELNEAQDSPRSIYAWARTEAGSDTLSRIDEALLTIREGQVEHLANFGV